ncbi:MAG: hypothetical protein WC489_07145 [Patescibacteria group bacterium]|jgi:hypothetical protein
MLANIVELNGRSNPTKKATKDGVKNIYRARLKGEGDPEITMVIKTENPDVLEDALPGLTKYLSMYDITLEKVEVGAGDDEDENE